MEEMKSYPNVIYTDVDTVWLADPRPFLAREYDLWTSLDEEHGDYRVYCVFRVQCLSRPCCALDRVVVVHNNWIKGKETKVQRFKDFGLWKMNSSSSSDETVTLDCNNVLLQLANAQAALAETESSLVRERKLKVVAQSVLAQERQSKQALEHALFNSYHGYMHERMFYGLRNFSVNVGPLAPLIILISI
jgi:hypothetical protein